MTGLSSLGLLSRDMPVVGVTASAHRGWPMWAFAWLSLRLHGVRARRITAPARRTEWDGLDGLMIGGGDDISADLYGLEPIPDIRVDPDRDRLELEGLAHFWSTDAPVLGVCRGSQMMNVYCGGSLHQDIHEVYQAPRLRTVLPRKTVTIEPDSALRDVVDAETIEVNALHHQSVDRPGAGFEIVARDEQSIVQATESGRTPFRIGVQWHPEFLFFRRAHRRLFRAFADAARAYRARKRSGGADAAS